MNQNQIPSRSPIRARQSPAPARAWAVVVIAAMVGLGLLASVVIAWKTISGRSQQELASPAIEPVRVPGTLTRPDRISTKPSLETAAPAEVEPAPDAKELVKTLAGVRPGALTPAAAAAWQQNLGKLLNLGTAAVPALREFFQRQEDVRFDSGPGPNLIGEPSLRIAFLKVLFDLPGPENVVLQAEVLKTATEPDEISLIARQLEQQEPGKHEGIIIEAAKEAMEIARSGGLPGRGTGPLVELLTKYVGPAGQ